MASSSNPLVDPLPSATTPRRPRPGERPALLLTLTVAVIGLVFTGPFAYVVVQNFRLGADFSDIFGSSDTWSPLGRSVQLGVAVAASASVIGTTLAWLVARSDLPARRLVAVLAPLPLVFPSFVGATALITGFATGGLLERVVEPVGVDELPQLAGFRAAWFVLTLFTYPYVYLPVVARLRRLPASVEESARLLGRRPLGVFTSVVLPQARSAISAGALLVFLYTISDFGAVELLRYDTLTRVIFSNRLADRGTAMALSLLLGVLALLVVAIERRMVRHDVPVAASSRPTGLRVPLRRWRWPAAVGVVGFVGIAIVGPLASLAHWTIRGMASSRSRGSLGLDGDGLGSAVTNTVLVSIVAAIVTVAVVLPIAYATVHYRSRTGAIANTFVVGGFALPGLVTALALVFWVLSSTAFVRVYQTLPLLVLAYVIHFGAQGTRASQVAVGGVPRRLTDAARMLGAGPVRRFLSVDLPIMVPGLLAAAGLVLLSTMKELPATLLLAPIGFDTLATEIWASMETLSYAQAGLESMVLLGVSAMLTWLLVIRAADRLD
ncbi:MAG: iron ABC transporter permease [Acidimicrobiia bacterium]|nr:iron ABC transporter permease [Acidimicrobiia bacterium]